MIRQDEHDFFIQNVAPHYENVARFLNYLCGDTYLADDIAQDVMEDTLNSIERVRTYNNIQAYLIDVAKKKWNKHCLKHKTWIPIDELANEVATTDEILEEVMKNATSTEFKKMLKLIDEKYSRVLVLHYYYQMPLKEIASVFNENYSTIRSWHIRALKKIKIIATKMKENDTT